MSVIALNLVSNVYYHLLGEYKSPATDVEEDAALYLCLPARCETKSARGLTPFTCGIVTHAGWNGRADCR